MPIDNRIKRALKRAVTIYSDKNVINNSPKDIFVIEYINPAGQIDYEPTFRKDIFTPIIIDDLTKLDGHNKKEPAKKLNIRTIICLIPAILYLLYATFWVIPEIAHHHTINNLAITLQVVYIMVATVLATFPYRKSRIVILIWFATLIAMNILGKINLHLTYSMQYMIIYLYMFIIIMLVLFLNWLNDNHMRMC